MFFILGLAPIGSSTEAREAHVIHSILSQHEWILPLRNGIVPSKPLLYHWICAFAAHFLGESAWLYRLVSAICGVGVLILTQMTAFNLSGSRAFSFSASDRTWLSLISMLILSLTFQFSSLMTEIRVDMTFCLFVSAAFYFFIRALKLGSAQALGPRLSLDGTSFNFFYLMCGLACLSRGPLGIVLPLFLALCSLCYLIGLKRAIFQLLRPRLGWLFFLLLVLPWYLLAISQGGESFVSKQLIFENLLRFFGGENVNQEAWWFYLPSYLRVALPWSWVLAFLVWQRLRAKFSPSAVGLGLMQKPELDLVLIWFSAGFLFFSLSSGKRHSYLLPLYPAASIYLAFWIKYRFDALSDKFRSKLLALPNQVNPFIFMLLLLLLLEAVRFDWSAANPMLMEIKGQIKDVLAPVQLLLVVSLFLFYLLKLNSAKHGALRLVSLWFLIYLSLTVCFQAGVMIKERLKGFDLVAAELRKAVGESPLRVLKFGPDEGFDVLLYYFGQPVKIVDPDVSQLGCEPHSNACYMKTLAHADWLPKLLPWASSKGLQVKNIAVFRELFDQAKGEEQNAFVLFQLLH